MITARAAGQQGKIRKVFSTGLKIAVPLCCTVVSLVIVKLVASKTFFSPEELARVLEKMGFAGPLAFVFALAVRPLTLLPGQAFTAVAGMMWGTFWGAFVSVLGSWLSTMLVLTIGQRLLRRPLARWSGERREELTRVAEKHSFLYGLVVTLNPLLPTDVCLALAAGAGARFSRLAAGAVMGTVPGTITTAMFGSALTKDRPWAMALSIAAMAVSIIGGGIIGHSVWKSLRRRSIVLEPAEVPELGAAVPGRGALRPQFVLVEADRPERPEAVASIDGPGEP